MPKESEISENEKIYRKIEEQSKEIIVKIKKQASSKNLRQIEYWINQIQFEFFPSNIPLLALIIDTIHCYFKNNFSRKERTSIEAKLCMFIHSFDPFSSEFEASIINFNSILKKYVSIGNDQLVLNENQFSSFNKFVAAVSSTMVFNKFIENCNRPSFFKFIDTISKNFNSLKNKSNVNYIEPIIIDPSNTGNIISVDPLTKNKQKRSRNNGNMTKDFYQEDEFLSDIKRLFNDVNEINSNKNDFEQLNDGLAQELHKAQYEKNQKLEYDFNFLEHLPFANESFIDASQDNFEIKKIYRTDLKEIFRKSFKHCLNKDDFFFRLEIKINELSYSKEIRKFFKYFFDEFNSINTEIDYILKTYRHYSDVLKKIISSNKKFLFIDEPSNNFEEIEEILTVLNYREILPDLVKIEFNYFIFDRHAEIQVFLDELFKESNKKIISESIEIFEKFIKNSPEYLFHAFPEFIEKVYSKANAKLEFLKDHLFLFLEHPTFSYFKIFKQGFFSKNSIQWLTNDFLTKEIKTKISYNQQIIEFLKRKSWIELLFKYHIICWFGKLKEDIQKKITTYIVSVTYELCINRIKELIENINIRKNQITSRDESQQILSNLIDLIQQLLIFENQWKMENNNKYLFRNNFINQLRESPPDKALMKLLSFAFMLKEDLADEKTKDLEKKVNILKDEAKVIKKFCTFFKFPREEEINFLEPPHLSIF